MFDLVLKTIKKYRAHPRILSIKEKMNNKVPSFRNLTYQEILNKINSFDTSRLAQSEDTPSKIIKDNADIFVNFILKNFSKCIINGTFPEKLKKADVSLAFKKGNHNDKTNNRPVSLLALLSKIYERLIYNQINQVTENALSIFQCGVTKNYGTHYALISMIEKAKKNPR